MNTLLMFSGGLDSTGALWSLADEHQGILYIHHMNLRNREKRAVAESKAVHAILAYFKNKGIKFEYSESSHEYSAFGQNAMWDSDIVSFMAGCICLARGTIGEVAIGMTASDFNPSLSERMKRSSIIFDAFGTGAKKIYPIANFTKREIYKILPEDLKKLTWSCRRPVYQGDNILPCKRCHTCIELENIYEIN